MGYHFHHESSDNTVNQFATSPRVWLSFIFGCSLLSGCFDAAGPSPPHSVRTGDVVLDNPDVTASAEELETERLGLLAGELACAEARYKNKTARTQAREAALLRADMTESEFLKRRERLGESPHFLSGQRRGRARCEVRPPPGFSERRRSLMELTVLSRCMHARSADPDEIAAALR